MSLPDDFDYLIYLSLNPDLKQTCSYEEAVDHYLNYGIKENRKYKDDEENNMHLLVVVVSCNKHTHLWEKLKHKTNNDLVIISGINNRDISKRYYDKNNKILWLNCNDYYDGLPEKIVLMIDEVLHNSEFNHITHILKIDDHDTEFTDKNIKNLYKFNVIKKYDYLGQKQNCWNNNKNCSYHFGKVPEWSYWYNRTADVSDIVYFDGGCSYILSRKAMEIINKKYNESNIDELRIDEIYEDVMIGRILKNHNILSKELNYGIKGDK